MGVPWQPTFIAVVIVVLYNRCSGKPILSTPSWLNLSIARAFVLPSIHVVFNIDLLNASLTYIAVAIAYNVASKYWQVCNLNLRGFATLALESELENRLAYTESTKLGIRSIEASIHISVLRNNDTLSNNLFNWVELGTNRATCAFSTDIELSINGRNFASAINVNKFATTLKCSKTS